MKLIDQLNRPLHFEKSPKRIISLVPSQTELLIDLGLKDRLVGVTKFCVHPENIRKEKKIVGGTKGVRMDRIKELNPDIILCNKEENTKEMIDELKEHYSLHISDVNNLEDTFELIQQYGEIFEVKDRAEEIIENIKTKRDEFLNYIAKKPILKVAYFIWRKPWMVAGSENFIDYMLKLSRFENVYADIPRYPEVELENLKQTDFIFLSSEPYPFEEKHIPEIKSIVSNTDFALVDGEFFSWYGSRLEKAFSYFMELRKSLEK